MISDKAEKDFDYDLTERERDIVRLFRKFLNEVVVCPECKGTVERTRRDDKGNLNLTCPTCYREGKVPRYKLYEEEVVM